MATLTATMFANHAFMPRPTLATVSVDTLMTVVTTDTRIQRVNLVVRVGRDCIPSRIRAAT